MFSLFFGLLAFSYLFQHFKFQLRKTSKQSKPYNHHVFLSSFLFIYSLKEHVWSPGISSAIARRHYFCNLKPDILDYTALQI